MFSISEGFIRWRVLSWLFELPGPGQEITPSNELTVVISENVLDNVQWLEVVSLQQVRVLTDLGMFSEAVKVLMGLLLGEKLPKKSDIGFGTVESKKVTFMMIVWYLLNPSFLSSIIFTIEITRVLSLVLVFFPSDIFSSIQQQGISFTSRKFSGK